MKRYAWEAAACAAQAAVFYGLPLLAVGSLARRIGRRKADEA